MTTYAERQKIEVDAQASPSAPPAGSSAADVTAANKLLVVVRQALLDVAEEILAAPSGEGRTRILWARGVLANSTNSDALQALRILLARFDAVTPAQALATTDKAAHDAVLSLVPVLSSGLRD